VCSVTWSDTKGDWSQRMQRRGAIFTDQWGRKYSAVIETKTGDELSMQPMFEAPLATPQQYFEPHPSADRPNSRVINYTRWKDDIRRATADWELNGRTIARQIPGQGIMPDGSFSLAVLDQIGPKPMAIEPVIAASQGNRYVLGLSKIPHPKLAKFFEKAPAEERYVDEEDFRDTPQPRRAHRGVDDDDWTALDDSDPLDETSEQALAREIDALPPGGRAGFTSAEALEEEHDPGAVGGHRVPPGKPAPGKRPAGTPRKSHHKKKDLSPPTPAGSPA
jgi:hypothetical protein